MISILALSLMATALPAEGSASASEMEALTQRDTAAASVIYSGVRLPLHRQRKGYT